MRAASAFIVLGALWTGEAAASSFLVLAPSPDAPSIVTLGEPPSPDVATLPPTDPKDQPDVVVGEVDAPDKPDPAGSGIEMLSPSIIAMGEPDVADEKVAAIGEEKPRSRREPPLPMVIRGGVVGDAFSPVSVSAPAPVAAEPQAGDQQEQANETPRGAAQPSASEPQPAAPPPAPASPPATSKLE